MHHIGPGRSTVGRRNFSVRGTLIAASAAVFLMTSGVAAADAGVATLATPAPPGSSPAPGASQPPIDPQEATLAFVACMREHGVAMADPEFTSDGGTLFRSGTAGGPGETGAGTGMVTSGGPDDHEFQAAQEACRSLMPAQMSEPDPARQAEMQEQALAFAKCMREHGIDMPDPQFTADGGMTQMITSKAGDEADMDAANTACQSLMPGAPGGPSLDSGDGGGTFIGGPPPSEVTR